MPWFARIATQLSQVWTSIVNNSEKLKYMEMLRRQLIVEGMLATRRRAAIHRVYEEMGFDVVTGQDLSKQPFIPTSARFVEVEPDFYEKD